MERAHLYDNSRLTIGGFSAGGGLAFAVSQNDELGRKYVKGVVGMYPYLDVENIPGVARRVRLMLSQSYFHLIYLFWTMFFPTFEGSSGRDFCVPVAAAFQIVQSCLCTSTKPPI